MSDAGRNEIRATDINEERETQREYQEDQSFHERNLWGVIRNARKGRIFLRSFTTFGI